MNLLPNDVFRLIFRLLPVSSQITIQFVTKKFRNIILPQKPLPPPRISNQACVKLLVQVYEDGGTVLGKWFIEYLSYYYSFPDLLKGKQYAARIRIAILQHSICYYYLFYK